MQIAKHDDTITTTATIQECGNRMSGGPDNPRKFNWGSNMVFWLPHPELLQRRIFWYTGQLILGKIIKIVAIGCQILSLKRTKSDFGGSSAPDPAGGAYIAPLDPLVGFKGVSSKCGTHDFDPPVKKK